jgi:hypothetical protein
MDKKKFVLQKSTSNLLRASSVVSYDSSVRSERGGGGGALEIVIKKGLKFQPKK